MPEDALLVNPRPINPGPINPDLKKPDPIDSSLIILGPVETGLTGTDALHPDPPRHRPFAGSRIST